MTAADLTVNLVLSAFLIVGAYQLYFWCQRNATRPPRELGLAIDHRIPYRPGWVWIYSVLYYPVILYVNLVLQTPAEFTRVAFSFLMLLAFQVVCFLGFPVTTPEHWRSINGRRTWSERFLAFVQRFDARSNSFPSMHTSVATLAALHLHPHVGAWAWCFPLLIGISCLFTKQHYVVDVPAGAALGWGTFGVYRAIL
jgi:membrane-associated phospholipid phosphatase